MGPENGGPTDGRMGRPWETWSTDREEQMQTLEDIGISRLEIILNYGGDPFNYPEDPVEMPEEKRKTIIDTYFIKKEEEPPVSGGGDDSSRKTREEIDAQARETFGMTIEEAMSNPGAVLDMIETYITKLEKEKKDNRLSDKLEPVTSVELSMAMVLATRVEDKIKEAGLEDRYLDLKKRREALRKTI